MAARTVEVIVTGNAKSFEDAMAKAGYSASAAADGIGTKMDAASTKVGGIFDKLGNQLSSWGLPFGESVSGIGKKFDEANTKGQKFTSAMSTLGGAALLGVSAAAVGVGYEAVKMGQSFQEATTLLVTGAGESEKNIDMIRQGILNMAGDVGQTPMELAQGMFMIESAGYHGAAGLQVLRSAATGAAVGGAQMETVASALTTAMHDYNVPTSHANQVTSALIETVASGKTHLEDLASSLGKVMPQAAALGVPFQDVTGALATMTNAGLSARLASMRLSNTLLSMSAPSKTASAAMASVGLSGQQVKDTLKGPGGLSAALQLIEKHVSDTFPKGSVAGVNAFKSIMGGATGYSAALMLSGAHSKEFEQNVKNIGDRLNGSGKSVQGFSMTQKDLAFQTAQAKATMDALGTKLGLLLIPKLQQGAAMVGRMVSWLEKNKIVAEALGVTIATVLGAAVTIFAVEKAKKFVSGISDMIKGAQRMGEAAWQMASKLVLSSRTMDDSFSGIGDSAKVAEVETTTAMEGTEASTVAASEGIDVAIGSTGIGAVLIGLSIGVMLLATHWKQVWGDIKNWAMDAYHFIDRIIHSGIGQALLWVTVPLIMLGTHWKAVWGDIQSTALTAWNFINGNVFQPIENFVSGTWNMMMGSISSAWSSTWNGLSSVVSSIWGGIKAAIDVGIGYINRLIHAFDDVTGFLHIGPHVADIPMLATGGPAMAGMPYIVGEKGPELFVPAQSGTVVSNAALRSGSPLGGIPSLNGANGTTSTTGNGTTINLYAQTNATAEHIVDELDWFYRTGSKVP